MDDPQNLESQSLKDRPWTTDEIRKHSSNWTLAGDVGLFNLLNEFSQQIIARTHEVENALDSLVHDTKMTTAKVNNVINDFHMLSNLQFVENRVYDEEIQEPSTENRTIPEKTKEQREAEMLPKITQAIELGLSVLDTAFDRINVNEISDSEDEEDISSEGRTILEPKDPYENRPLPYIIGSAEFMKCDYAGLKDLIEEEAPSFSEESSLSETDETSSDEGEPLPLDDDKFSGKPIGLIAQNMVDQISSSDESELFGSEKEVNGFGSESSLEVAKEKEKHIQKTPGETQPVKDTRQGSVASIQSKLKLPQVLPVPQLHEKKEDKEDDLFASEEHSDDESPFRKKTGLFTSDIRFNDEKDDLFGGDLFGKSPSKDIKEVKPKNEVPKVKPEKPKSVVPETKEPALFGSDEDSEDDIFKTLMTKKPSISKASNAGSQDSSEKADTSSTPSSAPSTKPSGNAFDFVTGAGGNTDSLFGDDSEGDDLFSSKKTKGKKMDFDSSENEDLFGIVPVKTSKESKESKKAESEKPQLPNEKPILNKNISPAQGKPTSAKPPLSIIPQSKKGISLFDDDDDSEDDIFSKVTKGSKSSTTVEKSKSTNLFEDSDEVIMESKSSTVPEKSKSLNLFEDLEKVTQKETKPEKKPAEKTKTFSLFDDTEEESESVLPIVPKNQQSKVSSLFEDSDSYDLFAPKPSIMKNEPTKPISKPAKPIPESAKPAVGSIKPAVGSTKPAVELMKPAVELMKPAVEVMKPAVELTKPAVELTKPAVDLTKPAVESTKPAVESTKPAVESKKSPAESTKSPVQPAKPDSVLVEVIKVPKLNEVTTVNKESSDENQVSFDTPIDSSNVLNVINKGRAKVTTKRRKPTRQGRLAALENSEKETESESVVKSEILAKKPDLGILDDDSDSLFSEKPPVKTEPPKIDHKTQEKKKMNLMSQLMSEVVTSKVALKRAAEKEEKEEDDEFDIFSAAKRDRSKSSFSFQPPEENGIASMFPIEKKEDKKEEDSTVSKSDSFEDDFFTEPAFQNFRSSVSHKDSILDMDDDDDDDLFSAIKSNILPKVKTEAPESKDLFSDETDIFADVQKEKYEMFPNQVYDDDDDDDDIFSNSTGTKTSNKTSNAAAVKKVETKQVNAFDDPLTGLLGE